MTSTDYNVIQHTDNNTFNSNVLAPPVCGRKISVKTLFIIGEIFEAIGIGLQNGGVFSDNKPVTIAGLSVILLGIATIFVMETTVNGRARAEGIKWNCEKVSSFALRAFGGIALMAGYFALIAGLIKNSSSLQIGAVITQDVGVLCGSVGLAWMIRAFQI